MKINGETAVEVPGIGAVRVRRMERGSTYFHPQASHRQSFAFEGVGGREFFGELVRQRVGNGREYVVTVYLRQRCANGICRELPETHCQRVRTCLETYFRKAVREYAEQIDAAPVVAEPAPRIRRDNVEYHQGRSAFEAGVSFESCPFLAGERAARWKLGWNEMRADVVRAGRIIAHDCERGECSADELAPYGDKVTESVRRRLAMQEAAPVAKPEPAPVDAFGLSPLIIDMTPTWAAIMPALIAALENGTETGKDMARKELMRLAQTVDALNSKESK